MKIDELQRAALEHGLNLEALSLTVKQTVREVHGGNRTARQLGESVRLSPTAAGNRLAAATRLRLLKTEMRGLVKYYTLADGVDAFPWVGSRVE